KSLFNFEFDSDPPPRSLARLALLVPARYRTTPDNGDGPPTALFIQYGAESGNRARNAGRLFASAAQSQVRTGQKESTPFLSASNWSGSGGVCMTAGLLEWRCVGRFRGRISQVRTAQTSAATRRSPLG